MEIWYKADFVVEGEVSLPDSSLKQMAEYMEHGSEKFRQGVLNVHRKSVFQGLIKLLKLCPVDTGRLRGSWTPFMDAHGFQGYQPFIDQPSELGDTRKSKKKGFSAADYRAGKAQGSWSDAGPLSTTITTNVVYAGVIDARLGLLTRLLAWMDGQYSRNFERFFEASKKAGWIVEQNPNDVPVS